MNTNETRTITQAEYDMLSRRNLVLEHIFAHEDKGTVFLDKLTMDVYKRFLGVDQEKENAE